MKIYGSYAEVDCERLCNNIQVIQRGIGEKRAIIPVLKCDAYGLGAVAVAKELSKMPKIHRFAVAHVMEALELKQSGIHQAVMTMAGLPESHIKPALAGGVELTVYSLPIARAIASAAKAEGKPAPIHIKIETGLNRLGLHPGEELDELIHLIKEGWLHVVSAYSHFIDSEIRDSALAPIQLDRYLSAIRQLEAAGIEVPLRHMCNSAASECYDEALLDGARIGRRLYMDSQRYPKPAHSPDAIQEVASWRTEIIQLKLIMPGEAVGYDSAFKATAPTLVATIPVGYGDGLDERLLQAQAPLLVTPEGHEARYLAICMDQSLIDVSGIPCKTGDEVTLFGRTSGGKLLPAQQVNGAIHHEGAYIMSRIGRRVERVYIKQRP